MSDDTNQINQINLTETNEFFSFTPPSGLKKFIVTYIASDETSHSVLVSYNEETHAYETKGDDVAVKAVSGEVRVDKSFTKAGSRITVSTVPEKEAMMTTASESTPASTTDTPVTAATADAITINAQQQGGLFFLYITPGANNRNIKVTYTGKDDTLHTDTYEKGGESNELWQLHVRGEEGGIIAKTFNLIPLQIDISNAKPGTRIHVVASTGNFGDLEYTATYDVPSAAVEDTVVEDTPVNKGSEPAGKQEPDTVAAAPQTTTPAVPAPGVPAHTEVPAADSNVPSSTNEKEKESTMKNQETPINVTEPKEADLPLLEEVENTRILAVTPGEDNVAMVITLSSLEKDEEVLITARKQNDTWVLDNQDTYLKYIIDVKGNGQGFLINLGYVVNGSLIKIMASNSYGGAYVNGITYTNHFKKPRTLEEELVPQDSTLPLGYVTNMSELYETPHLVTDVIKDLLEKPANMLKKKWGVSKLQPILFLDLETTGLNPTEDDLLEFHAIFTYFDKESGKFIKLLEVGNTFYHPVPDITSNVPKVVIDMHFDNDLWKDCYHSKISCKYSDDKARYQTFYRLVKAFGKYSGEYDSSEERHKPVLVTLAGSSVHFDKAWIDHGHFGYDMQNRTISYRVLDATSFVLADSLYDYVRSTEEEDILLLPERVRNGVKHRAAFDIHLSLVRLEKYLSRMKAPTKQED